MLAHGILHFIDSSITDSRQNSETSSSSFSHAEVSAIPTFSFLKNFDYSFSIAINIFEKMFFHIIISLLNFNGDFSIDRLSKHLIRKNYFFTDMGIGMSIHVSFAFMDG